MCFLGHAHASQAIANAEAVELLGYWRSTSSWRVRIALAHHGVDFRNTPAAWRPLAETTLAAILARKGRLTGKMARLW